MIPLHFLRLAAPSHLFLALVWAHLAYVWRWNRWFKHWLRELFAFWLWGCLRDYSNVFDPVYLMRRMMACRLYLYWAQLCRAPVEFFSAILSLLFLLRDLAKFLPQFLYDKNFSGYCAKQSSRGCWTEKRRYASPSWPQWRPLSISNWLCTLLQFWIAIAIHFIVSASFRILHVCRPWFLQIYRRLM